MRVNYRELDARLEANNDALARITADRKALQDEIDRAIKKPLALHAEIGRSVIKKSWTSSELYGSTGLAPETFPAGEEFDWVRYPFSVKGLNDDHIILEYSKAQAGAMFNGPRDTFSATVSVDILDMTDRAFASMIRKEIRRRKAFLVQRAKAEEATLSRLERLRHEIEKRELQIANLRKMRSQLLTEQIALRQEQS